MCKPRVVMSGLLALASLAACSSAPIQLHDGQAGEGPVATLILPEQLEVATINGLEIAGAGGLLKKGDTILEVKPGRYEVLAYYRELWERGDQHHMLRSDPALFVVDAAAGRKYRLDYVRPGTLSEAKALAAAFQGWVEDAATGTRIPSRESGLQFRKGLVPAATFDDSLVPSAGSDAKRQRVPPLARPGEAEDVPQTRSVAPPQQVGIVPVSPVDAPQNADAAGTGRETIDWLSLMKTWWSEASPQERREFLHWISDRP